MKRISYDFFLGDDAMKKNLSTNKINRRGFMRSTLLASAATALSPQNLLSLDQKTDVWVLHGKDKKKLMKRCMQIIVDHGGFSNNPISMAIKVNAAWARKPEEGANTHPELVDGLIKESKALGVKEIVIPEHSTLQARRTFPRSGILDVAKANKVSMIDLGTQKAHFQDVKIPNGIELTEARVAREFLEADVVVNMPVAKHHSACYLTIGMKNWLGAVEDRRVFHRNNLHQCIADICTLLKPNWSIVDATRIMPDSGPQGPSPNLKNPDLIIVSRDQVAADTYTSTLFMENPLMIEYLKIAGEMKIGENNLNNLSIHRIEIS